MTFELVYQGEGLVVGVSRALVPRLSSDGVEPRMDSGQERLFQRVLDERSDLLEGTP